MCDRYCVLVIKAQIPAFRLSSQFPHCTFPPPLRTSLSRSILVHAVLFTSITKTESRVETDNAYVSCGYVVDYARGSVEIEMKSWNLHTHY